MRRQLATRCPSSFCTTILRSFQSLGTFGSGRVWLVKDDDGVLDIVTTRNADYPITNDHTLLLTCDVWEHACHSDSGYAL